MTRDSGVSGPAPEEDGTAADLPPGSLRPRWRRLGDGSSCLALGRVELARVSPGRASDDWFYTPGFCLPDECSSFFDPTEAGAKAAAERHAAFALGAEIRPGADAEPAVATAAAAVTETAGAGGAAPMPCSFCGWRDDDVVPVMLGGCNGGAAICGPCARLFVDGFPVPPPQGGDAAGAYGRGRVRRAGVRRAAARPRGGAGWTGDVGGRVPPDVGLAHQGGEACRNLRLGPRAVPSRRSAPALS